MTMKHRPLSWTAKREGNRFCAPACGRGCTVEMHADAVRRGAWMAKKMGSGWRSVVWENLGWHAKAISPCGRLKIYWDGPLTGDYTAFLGEGEGGRWAESGKSMESAVRKVIARGKREHAELDALMRDLPTPKGGSRLPPKIVDAVGRALTVIAEHERRRSVRHTLAR